MARLRLADEATVNHVARSFAEWVDAPRAAISFDWLETALRSWVSTCERDLHRVVTCQAISLGFENRQAEAITTKTGIAVAADGVALARSRDQQLNEPTLECCGGRDQASPPPAPGLRAPEDVDRFPRKTQMSCDGERDYRAQDRGLVRNREGNHTEENAYAELQNACCSIFDVDRLDILCVCTVHGVRNISQSRSLEWTCGDARRQDGPGAGGRRSSRLYSEQCKCRNPRLLLTAIWCPGSGYAEDPHASSEVTTEYVLGVAGAGKIEARFSFPAIGASSLGEMIRERSGIALAAAIGSVLAIANDCVCAHNKCGAACIC